MLGKPIEDLLGKTMDELFPSDLAKEMIGDDLSVIRNGKPIKVVEELSGRTFETTKFPVLQPGKPPFLAGFTIDITERKRADQQREKLEAQLRQAQKMEAIGTLAGGIAHDFNNILSVIIGNAELLKMTDISFSDRGEVHHILSAAKRAKDLVRQILAFSRQGEQQKLLMSLKPVVKETVEFLRASIPSTIQLQHYIKPDTGAIMADPTQMQQVLMNLCTNAGHAMEKEGGVLKIELDTLEIGEADGKVDPEVENGEYVRVIISDTGHGIEPGILPRIFDPYFTTKGPEKGTGLGLSVVHGIVKSHGGIIKVYSEVGKGTVFHVLLPRADEAPKKEEKAVRLLPSGTERILVVDDEKPLVDIYQHMLGMLGYQVETRTSPVEALEAVRMNPQKYDLVITDMTMPQMTGYGFSKKLLEIRPGLPVILCTGFSDQVNEEKARSAGILAFLLKPVPLHDLANTMRKVLDETHREKHS
jgi:signal transduction histidine kinase/ActR/RegA family two-component response regulator